VERIDKLRRKKKTTTKKNKRPLKHRKEQRIRKKSKYGFKSYFKM